MRVRAMLKPRYSILHPKPPSSKLQPSCSNPSELQLQAPGLGAGAGSSSLEAGVWSLQPHPGGLFLGRVRGDRCCSSRGLLPPWIWSLQPRPGGFFLGRVRGDRCCSSRGLHPPWRDSWRLSSPILPRLGALVRHLALSWRSWASSCRQVAQRWRPAGPT